MKYLATEKFIEALNEWNEITKDNQATDFISLTFLICYKIGIKDNDFLLEESYEKRLNFLKERIKYLVENEKIDELFLISSLINYVTFLFNHYIQTHGDSILFHEKVLNEKPGMSVSKDVLERLKSPNYLIKLKNDYYRWKEIVAIELSEEKFENWERDFILENSQETLYDLNKLKDKYSNTTMGEILKKGL